MRRRVSQPACESLDEAKVCAWYGVLSISEQVQRLAGLQMD